MVFSEWNSVTGSDSSPFHTYGSKSLPSLSQRHSNASNAPSRLLAEFLKFQIDSHLIENVFAKRDRKTRPIHESEKNSQVEKKVSTMHRKAQ